MSLSEACRLAVEASRASSPAAALPEGASDEGKQAAEAVERSRVVREYMKLRQAVKALYGETQVAVSFKVCPKHGRP